ncbi:hypothetical protein SDC9_123445 [bioreactor metagenome]|uniref:Uncharacterized protein n=1 Tax=bioreactor metagenome TaxID=1076179 RepID=A0A645CHM2_9ZZZZ
MVVSALFFIDPAVQINQITHVPGAQLAPDGNAIRNAFRFAREGTFNDLHVSGYKSLPPRRQSADQASDLVVGQLIQPVQDIFSRPA